MLDLNANQQTTTIISAISVLLIEDNPDDAELIVRALTQGGLAPQITTVHSLEDVESRLACFSWDLIISDYSLRSFNALRALQLYKKQELDVPFILVSGTVGEETAVDVMRAGAHDYIMKSNLKRLMPAVKRELREADIRKAHRLAQKELFAFAHEDSVTGLPNRLYFLSQVAEKITKCSGMRLAIIIIDIPDLMHIQRVFGNTPYDSAAQIIAARLQQYQPQAVSIGRVGDYTFAVATYIMPLQQEQICKDVLSWFAEPVDIGFIKFHLDAYTGVSLCQDSQPGHETCFQHASFAVRQAHHAKNAYAIYLEASEREESDLMLLMGQLLDAIESKAIKVFYQPYINLHDQSIAGVEGLVRWLHPQRGLIMPGHFLAMAEQSGLVQPLTRGILHEAVSQEKLWLDAGHPLEISINLSARNLTEPDLPDMIDQIVTNNGLSPSYFVFEITESTFMHYPDESVASLTRLHDSGFRVAIDDFGTGFSALSYLRQLPVDRIKIDQTFIINLPHNQIDQSIVRSMIDLAHRLGIEIVAEGVESDEILDLLASYGCDKAQGYILTRPLPEPELRAWIQKSHRPVAPHHESKRRST